MEGTKGDTRGHEARRGDNHNGHKGARAGPAQDWMDDILLPRTSLGRLALGGGMR